MIKKEKIITILLLTFIMVINVPFNLVAQNNIPDTTEGYYSRDSITRKGYTLILVNKEASFDKNLLKRMEETFFKVYPPMAKRFNKNTVRKVQFVIEPEYDGVAATSRNRVVYNPEWFKKHPGDIDVVTHEVMHIIQAYGRTPGPFWLTEGIADYVRHTYGVDNEGAGWSMPDVAANHSYTNSYRISARFLVWAEQNKNKKIVDKLDDAMRNHTYKEELWKELTGMTLDELWKEYAANPEIKI